MIAPATRQQIKAVDLPALVSRDRALHKEAGGRRYRGLCPFHAEHTGSFVIYRGRDGYWRFRCFGCGAAGDAGDYVQRGEPGWSFADVLRSLGIQPGPMPTRQFTPIAPPPGATAHAKPLGPLVATYDYRFADGTLHYQECKHDPKDFRQRRPDSHGGWTYNLDGIEPLPYRLPELIADLAARPDDLIWQCEGAKDADRARAGGLIATTKSGGAGAPLSARLLPLVRGRTVVIAYDNDESGRDGADADADELCRAGATVIILDLGRAWPALAVKGDVSDFLDAWPVEVLHMLARVAPVLPAVDPDTGEIAGDPGLGDCSALLVELEQERAARLAAEAHARMMSQWGQVPNVRQGVKAVAPFVVNQYRAAVTAGKADADGWAPLNLPAIAETQDASIPAYEDRTPGQHKVVAARAEQAGVYVHDMDDYGWIETRLGEWTTNAHGRHYRPLEIRPRVDLSAPLALPVPDKKTARPRKALAICPQCHKSHTRQVVAYECLNADCRAVFTLEQADNAAELLDQAPALDPEISDQMTGGLLDPEISDQGETPPADTFRISRDAVWAMAQQRAARPPCPACGEPRPCLCDVAGRDGPVTRAAPARVTVGVGAYG